MIELHIGDIIQLRCQSWHIRDSDGLALRLKCLDDGSDLTLPVAMLLCDDSFVGPDASGPSIADQRLLDLATDDPARARALAGEVADKVLANPVIESYRIEVD